MKLRIFYLVIATMCLCTCSDGSNDPGMPTGSSDAATPNGETVNTSGEYTRESFVLCPALENHREELASLVGFEHDPERALSMFADSKECFIRGKEGNFIGVAIPPAFVSSVEQWTQGYDATASPASELGEDAVFVEDVSQPHMLFKMGPILIDVQAHYNEKNPDRSTMTSLAMRVRDILAEANQEG